MTGPDGVSAVVCCYSAARLPEAIRQLSAQLVPGGVGFEVVVVGNASTGDTADLVNKLWPAAHPATSLVGGHGESVGEYPQADYVGRYASHFSVGPPHGQPAGGLTATTRMVQGAGPTIRRAARASLVDRGFRLLGTDRVGGRLTGGGDVELCSAVPLAGRQIRYDPRLRFCRFVPRERLAWWYFCRLVRGRAAPNVLYVLSYARFGHLWARRGWAGRAAAAAVAAGWAERRSDRAVRVLNGIGFLEGLFAVRGWLGEMIAEVGRAAWNTRAAESAGGGV